jgi:predicted cobalt transporter CbtA
MKEKKWGKFILALFFLVIFVVLTLISLTYSHKARRLPLIVAIPGIALSAVQVLKERKLLQATKKVESVETHDSETPATEAPHAKKKLLVMIGWMVLLVGMIWIIGFLLTIPIYTILYMRSMKESWRLSILFAAAGFAILYFLFVVGLNMELYPGLLFQL